MKQLDIHFIVVVIVSLIVWLFLCLYLSGCTTIPRCQREAEIFADTSIPMAERQKMYQQWKKRCWNWRWIYPGPAERRLQVRKKYTSLPASAPGFYVIAE